MDLPSKNNYRFSLLCAFTVVSFLVTFFASVYILHEAYYTGDIYCHIKFNKSGTLTKSPFRLYHKLIYSAISSVVSCFLFLLLVLYMVYCERQRRIYRSAFNYDSSSI
jgi:hypothetical protein